MTRVFLSHASEDKPFVDALYSHLSVQNIDCWFDKHEIFLGDNIPEKINEGLATSDFGILILSKNYLRESKYWTWEELFALINKESTGETRILLPIRLGLDHAALTKRVPLIAARLSVDFVDRPREAAEEILRAIGRGQGSQLRPITGASLPAIGLPSRHTVKDSKPQPLDCVGRENFLADVTAFFESNAKKDLSEIGLLSVSGLPGAGKSTVALELAYRFGRGFPGGVYWINACSSGQIISSLKEIIFISRGGGDLLSSGLEFDKASVDEQCDIARRLFETEPCLLIVDSLDTEFAVQANILRLLPRTGASRILVTTRSERLDIPLRVTNKNLPDLTDADVEALLLQFQSRDNTDQTRVAVKSVADKLGRLPLALQIAARSMRDACIGIREYDNKLAATPDILLGLTTRSRFIPSLTKLLEDCYESLKEKGEVGVIARKILSRCAVISMVDGRLYRWEKEDEAGQNFPLGIAASLGFRSIRDVSASLFNEAVELAESRGLLRTRGDLGNGIWVHALTLEMLNKKADEEDFQYLAFRYRLESNFCFAMFEVVGWIEIHPMMQRYANVISIMQHKSVSATLEVIDTWLELEPFMGTNTIDGRVLSYDSPIDGEELAQRAVTLIDDCLPDSNWNQALLHFKILRAHAAYYRQRTLSAKEQFYSIWISLEEQPEEIQLLDLLDLGFHFGCLLVRLKDEENLLLARRVWEIMLKNVLHLPKSEDRFVQLSQPIKLRLSRLLEAVHETFSDLLDVQLNKIRLELLEGLKQSLEFPFSLTGQFHRARGPFVPFLSCRFVIDKD